MLILSNNEIETIDGIEVSQAKLLLRNIIVSSDLPSIFQSFGRLQRLEYIDLSSNKLTSLHGDEFTPLKSLRNLTLANNGNIGAHVGQLLNAPSLEALNLSNCGLGHLDDGSLAGLPNLVALDLRNNPLKLGDNVFKSLGNLRSLQLPSVDKTQIYDICNALTSIDLISLPEYDVSCFAIASGSSFDDSTVRLGVNTLPPLYDYNDGESWPHYCLHTPNNYRFGINYFQMNSTR